MATDSYTYVRGDTLPVIPCVYELEDDAGNAVAQDITGCTFELAFDKGDAIVSKQATITDAAHGKFQFQFGVGDLDTVGRFAVRITMTTASQGRESFQTFSIIVVEAHGLP